MTTSNLRIPLLALSFLAAAACDTSDADPAFGEGDVENRCGQCGIKLNTNKIGDHVFSEIDTNGEKHDGVALLYVELHRYGKLDKVSVENGQLVGLIGNTVYDGEQFQHSIWHLSVEMQPDTWQEATMEITNVTEDPYGQYGWKYTFVHQYIGGNKEYFPNCDKDENAANGEEFDAIVTGDISVADKAHLVKRPNTIFIGCTSGGVGKAGLWGYPLHKVNSPERFTGAVRMVRADYCGIGESFTKPGQPVSVTDVWGINYLAQNVKLEALWDENGAACVYEPRLNNTYSLSDVEHTCDDLGGRPITECKSDWGLGDLPDVLFMSTTPP